MIGKHISPDVGKATQFKPGVAVPGAGRPKGTRSLSSTIQDLMEDDDFEIKLKDGQILKGRPSKKIAEVMYGMAISGNTKAADWLAKYGYGNKVDVTTNGESINAIPEADGEVITEWKQFLKSKTKSE